jgi:hypothetical protein
VPTGKAEIISRRAWRTTLSRAIESGSWSSEHCPDTERPDVIAARRSRLSYGINIRSARLLAKPNTLALARNELRTLRCKLREAVKFYQLAHAEPLPTPTYRRKQLTNVKTAAARLFENPRSEVWAKRLAKYIRAVLTDRGAETLLTKALARGTGERFGKLTALLGELDAIVRLAGVPEAAVARADRFVRDWLPRIGVLAELKVEDMVPISQLLPDPGLPNLVADLEPIWCRATGRTAALVSKDNEGDLKKCLFADWLGELLKKAGLPPPPTGRVVDIVRSKN